MNSPWLLVLIILPNLFGNYQGKKIVQNSCISIINVLQNNEQNIGTTLILSILSQTFSLWFYFGLKTNFNFKSLIQSMKVFWYVITYSRFCLFFVWSLKHINKIKNKIKLVPKKDNPKLTCGAFLLWHNNKYVERINGENHQSGKLH